MKALRIDQHGPPSSLRVSEVPDPPLGPGQLRIAVEAAGINPSDAGSAAGNFKDAPLPRILGRDFAGRVIEGPEEWMGAEVWGTGGDLGISRDGTHAERIVLPVEEVARRPANLPAEQAAAVGVPFTTAWSALVDQGDLSEGDHVIVSGAAGAVGSAAIEIARARGARVIALVRDAEEGERLEREGLAGVAHSDRGDLTEVVAEATSGRGAELALNGVGAVLMRPLIEALKDGGRMVIYSAAGGREATLDLFELYRRRLTLSGVNTGILNAAAAARILTHLAPLFERGQMRVRQPIEVLPLSQAQEAYARVAEGDPAKLVLVPDAGEQG